ncbi:MAG: DNA polymerase III subunit gamma/tau [Bacteroidales bacterium]|nr:DNA polymerase III subunit gamma/tau [Bacteroidales bacterium]
MENFIVSARKYRPTTFKEVIGQENITLTLKNAIKTNHLAQAFLFCGPRGIGKTTCARILAKTINCKNITEDIEACDNCESCISFNNNTSFNIYELDAASNNSVDDIRNLVEQVRIPPQMGKYKVYIIDEVHMLSPSAFNAFLKTLEEPPEYAKFILATTEKHKIIPTILSRCQIFDFKRITIPDIVKQLEYVAKNENVEADSEALHVIAQKADGALRDALSIFDQIVSFSGKKITYQNVIENLNVLDYEYYFKITDYFLKGDIFNSLLIIDEIIENGFDGKYFIIGLGEHLRNLLVCKDNSTIKLLEVSKNNQEKYYSQSQKCSVNFLIKALEINNKCDINYKTTNNKRLQLELSIMQICSIISDANIKKEKKQSFIAPPPKVADKEIVYKKKNIETKNIKAKEIVKTVELKEETDKSENLPGSISIKQYLNADLNKIEDTKVEEKKTKEETYTNAADELNNEFSQYDLEKAWNKLAEKYQTIDPNIFSTLKHSKPVLKDKNNIVFTVSNKIQNDIFIKEKGRFISYLIDELENNKIDIITKIEIKKEDIKPYTTQEKFDKMAKINPKIVDLKNQLGLEIEF